MRKADLIRFVSKKGCSPDNSVCEGFFGRLKKEMFYGRNWRDKSINEFIYLLDKYMYRYCEKLRKVSLGDVSPM